MAIQFVDLAVISCSQTLSLIEAVSTFNHHHYQPLNFKTHSMDLNGGMDTMDTH